MSECCTSPACCTSVPDVGDLATVRSAPVGWTWADRLGAWRVRWNIRRGDYRVDPGLYTVGEPGPDAPVVVTANYKLTFDIVRIALAGRDAWLLILDTRGINVWCAAGKGTFGTTELAGKVMASDLANRVSHRTLIVPQLGATGVSAHDVRAFTGFSVVWSPVRAADLPAFIDAGYRATPEMRRISFGFRDRLVLVPVELSQLWRPRSLAVIAALVATAGFGVWGFSTDALVARGGALLLMFLAGALAGGLIVPALLPLVPFRMFAAKGALVGGLVSLSVAAAIVPAIGWLAASGLALAATALASYMAMNFTGATTFTSPSGVELEMRRSLPWQVAALASGTVLWVASAFLGRGL